MFVDQRHEVFWLSLPTSTPVLLPAVLLLQTLQDSAHLERQTCWYTSKQVGGLADRGTGDTCWDVL